MTPKEMILVLLNNRVLHLEDTIKTLKAKHPEFTDEKELAILHEAILLHKEMIAATENAIFEIPDILKNELKLAERDKHKNEYNKGYSSGLNVAVNFLTDKI